VGVRLRALAFLLLLTAGDYLLWNWSIANGHDIMSLVAGLTLLPLAAVSFGQLILAGGRLMALLLGSSSAPVRAREGLLENNAGELPPQLPAAKPNTSSGKLAA
jgi:hypothetical protein